MSRSGFHCEVLRLVIYEYDRLRGMTVLKITRSSLVRHNGNSGSQLNSIKNTHFIKIHIAGVNCQIYELITNQCKTSLSVNKFLLENDLVPKEIENQKQIRMIVTDIITKKRTRVSLVDYQL